MRDKMMFYDSFYKAISDVKSEKERAKLYDAVMKYAFEDIEPTLNGVSKTIFTLIKPQIDANNRRFINGSKGGRPIKIKTDGFTETKTDGFEIEKPNKNKNKKENKKENENKNKNVFFDDPEINDAFIDFVECRKKTKSPMTDRAIELAIKELIKLSGNKEEQIAIINQSVLNGWKSFYPLKNNQGKEIKPRYDTSGRHVESI